jgi:hypothetical protein
MFFFVGFVVAVKMDQTDGFCNVCVLVVVVVVRLGVSHPRFQLGYCGHLPNHITIDD